LSKKLHPNNVHLLGYDLDTLAKVNPKLLPFVKLNPKGRKTVDFSISKAVKELNSALLQFYYDILFWEFPDSNLCPPVPGRADYLHYINDLLRNPKEAKVLDIGTGATCIYPLLGSRMFGWKFVGTDISELSLKSSQKIINKNNLDSYIKLRLQSNKQHVLKGVLKSEDKFKVTVCNPPFYSSEREAIDANSRKTKNIGTKSGRNFAGTTDELWYKGGEKAFLHTYLYESSLYPSSSEWFTSLVSKKENIKSLKSSAKKLGVKRFEVIQMEQGNKITRIACWRY